ncbi:MAG TPA: hypothetical protein PKY56_07090 [Candidatus Kapabacteria bacterium]|nr:hypothetical protein [Candidatus Kapabacteria bacterium]HPO62741.1 hypothetical protein [Candidatus Kapabacteria bacterium]
MRSFITFFFVAIIFSSLAFCQDANRFLIGPSLGMKAGVNGAPSLEGRKNGLAFNGIPEIGISAFYWLSDTSNLAFHCDLSYSTYSFLQKSGINDKEFTEKFGYLKFGADFYFSNFLLGFGVGLPLSGDIEGNEIDTKILNALTEIRLAGWLPVVADETGTLNLFIQASYMLTGVFKDYSKNDPLLSYLPPSTPYNVAEKYNPRVVSLSIGFNYLFNLNL